MPAITRRLSEFCRQRAAALRTNRPASDAARSRTRPNRSSGSNPSSRPNRRRLLAAGGGVAATLLSGCSGLLGDGDAETPASNATTDATDGTPTERPEIEETDVVGLRYERDGSTYRFEVTLDPPNERGGADWWQVETLGGERIARRELDEPRLGDRFTTTGEATVDDGVSSVVVRGHGVDGEYGGQAMLANLEDGFIDAERQGEKRASFDDYSF